MKFNLLINYYIDVDDERQKELDYCLAQNLINTSIDHIGIFVSSKHYQHLKDMTEQVWPRVSLYRIVDYLRPSYNTYFGFFIHTEAQKQWVNIISNLDIIISEHTINQIKSGNYFDNPKTVLALTRYDLKEKDNLRDAVFFDRPDSQDIWFFLNDFPAIQGADFTLGIAGCDNKIAHLLSENGFNVINPSLTLKTYHLHNTPVRNYIDGSDIKQVPPPYKLIPPSV